MPRADADRCCYCDRPLGRTNDSGVCGICRIGRQCIVCSSPIYPDESGVTCVDCQPVLERMAWVHGHGCPLGVTPEQAAERGARLAELERRALVGVPLFDAA
jgi:hypothetical protein